MKTSRMAVPLALTLLAGCTGAPSGTAQKTAAATTGASTAQSSAIAAIHSLGIAGAKALFLGGSLKEAAAYRAQAVSQAPALFRLNADGTVAQVGATDASGSAVAFTPTYIAAASSSFVFLSAAGAGSFLVRRSDGLAAQVDTAVASGSDQDLVQTDAAGDVFYAFGGRLVRVSTAGAAAGYQTEGLGLGFSVQGVNSVTETVLNDGSAEDVHPGLAVDAAGDCAAVVKNGPSIALRLYEADGSVKDLNPEACIGGPGSPDPVNAVACPDGSLYDLSNPSGFKRVSVGADGSVAEAPVAGGAGGMPEGLPTLKADLSDRTALADSGWVGFLKDGAFKMAKAAVSPVAQMKASAGYAYVLGANASGTTEIDRVDPATLAETAVFSDPGYQVLSFSVTKDDVVTVSALRLSDNAYVVGTVSGGALTVESSSVPPVSTVLPLQ